MIKKLIAAFLLCLTGGVVHLAMAQSISTIFPVKVKSNSGIHTGDVYINVLTNDSVNLVTNFLFEKGSYGQWHSHPNAIQTMLVLSGEGYYQEEGKPKQLVKKGEVIITLPNVSHWNGATPWSHCECVTLTTKAQDLPHANQGREVTEKEFNDPIQQTDNE